MLFYILVVLFRVLLGQWSSIERAVVRLNHLPSLQEALLIDRVAAVPLLESSPGSPFHEPDSASQSCLPSLWRLQDAFLSQSLEQAALDSAAQIQKLWSPL